ncbi:hypothetical protein P3C29_10715 [Pseudomonas sp. 1912-s]|nr:hypothetical protein [Pseudomonas sp. 1912-s]MDF3199158.1 hypothetical protein [Pseudomonas sp. 1912-s]
MGFDPDFYRCHLSRTSKATMSINLDELLKTVDDEQSFIGFVKALGMDFAEERLLEETSPSSPYGPGALGRENGSIDTFLDAAAAWATASSRSSPVSASRSNVWQRCAAILLAGKFYE